MNPWLQRFLISWAAGVAASGAVISTAKKPGKLKKRKRKKKADGTEEPVQMGAVALRDARAAEERGLTVGEWRDNVVATTRGIGTRVVAVFRKEPKAVPRADDGSPREPDEVQAPDGTRLKTPPPSRTSQAARKTRKKRKGSHAKGRRAGGKPGKSGKRGRRPHATLWDSAKESFKQTVKETVKEEVKATPVGTAFEALKNVGAKVKEGASTAASAAASAVNKVIAENRAPPSTSKDEIPPHLRGESGEEPGAAPEAESQPPAAPPKVEETLEAIGRTIESAIHKVADSAKAAANDAGGEGSNEAAPPIQVADVAKKVKGGVDAMGSWLQGPGAPGYRRRVRPSSGADVVEAKDAPSKDAPPTNVPSQDVASQEMPSQEMPSQDEVQAKDAPAPPVPEEKKGDEARPTPPPDDEGKAAE